MGDGGAIDGEAIYPGMIATGILEQGAAAIGVAHEQARFGPWVGLDIQIQLGGVEFQRAIGLAGKITGSTGQHFNRTTERHCFIDVGAERGNSIADDGASRIFLRQRRGGLPGFQFALAQQTAQ